MDIGVGLPSGASTGHRVPASVFHRYARTAEEYGFGGLWQLDHIVEPPTYSTSFFDPLLALAMAAGSTDSIPLGTSILILPLRNPVMVAKRALTLQYLSDRTLNLGFGMGYADVEFDTVGVPSKDRASRFREGLSVLSDLLRGETVNIDGKHLQLTDVRLEPEPSIRPRLLAGGGGIERDGERVVPRGVRERMRHVDGWIAQPRAFEHLEHDWTTIANYLEANGQDPANFQRVAFQYIHLVPGVGSELATEKQRRVYRRLLVPEEGIAGGDAIDIDRYLTGSVDEVNTVIDRYRELGFDHLILYPATSRPHELLRQLDLWNRHIRC